MDKTTILGKIEEIKRVQEQSHQQLIACSGALQVLEELLQSEEKEKAEDETVKD